MRTAFDDWLQLAAAAGKGGSSLTLKDVRPAVRGDPWSMIVRLSGNWLTATLTAAIRAAPDAATSIADLTVSSPSYDSAAGKTTWTLSLAGGTGANTTGSLPPDTDGDGREVFPLAATLQPAGGSPQLLFAAAFYVSGKV